MRTAHTGDASTKLLLILATLAALATGLVYFIIALGLVAENFQSPPRPVMLLAGVIYVVGAGLMHVVDRRLLLLGAAANGVVLVLFMLSVARESATVDALSLGGKAAQVSLSLLLGWAGIRAIPHR
jgi:hypothetical protein